MKHIALILILVFLMGGCMPRKTLYPGDDSAGTRADTHATANRIDAINKQQAGFAGNPVHRLHRVLGDTSVTAKHVFAQDTVIVDKSIAPSETEHLFIQRGKSLFAKTTAPTTTGSYQATYKVYSTFNNATVSWMGSYLVEGCVPLLKPVSGTINLGPPGYGYGTSGEITGPDIAAEAACLCAYYTGWMSSLWDWPCGSGAPPYAQMESTLTPISCGIVGDVTTSFSDSPDRVINGPTPDFPPTMPYSPFGIDITGYGSCTGAPMIATYKLASVESVPLDGGTPNSTITLSGDYSEKPVTLKVPSTQITLYISSDNDMTAYVEVTTAADIYTSSSVQIAAAQKFQKAVFTLPYGIIDVLQNISLILQANSSQLAVYVDQIRIGKQLIETFNYAKNKTDNDGHPEIVCSNTKGTWTLQSFATGDDLRSTGKRFKIDPVNDPTVQVY